MGRTAIDIHELVEVDVDLTCSFGFHQAAASSCQFWHENYKICLPDAN